MKASLPSPHLSISLVWTILCLTLSRSISCHALGESHGRHSYSLSTFDPTGNLAQVERAARAASLGPPVIAVSLNNGAGVIMASLFNTPSPLIDDDGTARFVRIADTLALSHSGISADGRAMAAAAQRMAVEWSYTFDEEDGIPIDVFLEELSALFQSYTMKPGARPFGCAALVAHIPPDDGSCSSSSSSTARPCRLYRIDPSGAVQMVRPICGIGGEGRTAKMVQSLEDRGCADADSIEEAEEILLDVLRSEINEDLPAATTSLDGQTKPKSAFLVSSLTPQRGLEVRKVLPPPIDI